MFSIQQFHGDSSGKRIGEDGATPFRETAVATIEGKLRGALRKNSSRKYMIYECRRNDVIWNKNKGRNRGCNVIFVGLLNINKLYFKTYL